MPAYKYKSEEDHQRHLEKRREHYRKNRDKIRQQNDASNRRRKERDPEAYIAARAAARTKSRPKQNKKIVKLSDSPDFEAIVLALQQENEDELFNR